ncbi:MAG: serine hydrolase [Vicinamibacterales bacterium]
MTSTHRLVALALTALLALPSAASAQNRAVLEAELERLRVALGIPQMSAAVAESGTIVWIRHFGSPARRGDVIRYPIASLTKPFTAALAFRLADEQKLSLDVPEVAADTHVSLRRLLSHTSAGGASSRFVYSRDLFNRLQAPMERAAGVRFAQALAATVLRPAGLRHTESSPTLSPSTGLISTVEDVARFAAALEGGTVVSRAGLTQMFQPARDEGNRPLPYAHGWFVQQIGGQQVRWHFGQDAQAASLLVSLPGRRLTLVVLARSDRLSRPFWLQFGDLRWSPAAMTFLTQWAKLRADLPEARAMMTDALVALATDQRARASALAARAAALAPALVNAPDLTLLAAFARSGDRTVRDMGRVIARRVLAADPPHPRALVDLAVLNLQDGQAGEAKKLLQRTLDERQATPEIEALARQLLKEISNPPIGDRLKPLTDHRGSFPASPARSTTSPPPARPPR